MFPKLSRPVQLLFVLFAIIKLAIHLVADSGSGFQGDELLHIQTGEHLAWGYREFPPMIGLLSFIQRFGGPGSIYAQHFFPHLASVLIIYLIVRTTVELGGGTWAVVLSLCGFIAAPAFGRSQQLFQPTVFSQLGWLFCFYLLVRLLKGGSDRQLLALGIGIALSILVKYDALFFAAGLIPLLAFKRSSSCIWKPALLPAIAIALLLVSPNLIWQWQHGFPLREHLQELYRSQLEQLTLFQVWRSLFIELNPFTAVLWVMGIITIVRKFRSYAGWYSGLSILFSLLLLAAFQAKAYYYYPAMLCLMFFGAVELEVLYRNRKKTILGLAITLLLVSGFLMIPFSLPVLPLSKYLRYAHVKEVSGRKPVPFTEYYSKEQWPLLLEALSHTYKQLSPEQQANCLIWGKHYSQAAALAIWGKQYGLPPAFSYHGSFFDWAPKGELPSVVIAYCQNDAGIDFFSPFFNKVEEVSRVYNPYAKDEAAAWQTIFICYEPRQNFDALKRLFRHRIFE